MAPILADGFSGMEDVGLLDNVAVNCEVGALLATLADGEVEGITLDGLAAEACDVSVVVAGFGTNGLRFVDVAGVTDADPGARTHRDPGHDRPREQYGQTGMVVVGRHENAVVDVDTSDYIAPSDRPICMWLRSFETNAVQNVTVPGCTFDGLDTGVRTSRLGEGKSTRGATGEGFSDVRIAESTFLDNATAFGTESPGGRIKTGHGLAVHRSDFVGHDVAVDNADGGGVVTAECNFWGHATGPTHDDNRPGQGDAVTDGVDYAPWLPRSFETVPEEACHVGQQHDG